MAAVLLHAVSAKPVLSYVLASVHAVLTVVIAKLLVTLIMCTLAFKVLASAYSGFEGSAHAC